MSAKVQMPPAFQTAALSGVNDTQGDQKPGKAFGFKDAFPGLNVDQLNLSAEAKTKVSFARSQFELNYQVLRSMNSANGFQTSEESFSFQASYEFLQRAAGRAGSEDTDVTDAEKAGERGKSQRKQHGKGTAEGAEVTEGQETAQDQIARMMEYFSPENTAARILDMATSFFAVSEVGQTEGNNETARRKFADFIGGAIDEGFSQARGILGNIPSDISDGIDKTHTLVFEGLENFVKNGIDTEKSRPGGVYEKIAAYRAEAIAVSASVKGSTSGTYNAQGKISDTPPAN